jgi:cell division septation protein DedD
MSSTSENETEILLGNRHLLAIFFVLAVLLGIAFTGGYMVGRNGADKKPAALSASTDPTASTSTGLETHALTPAGDNGDSAEPPSTGQTHTVQPPPPPDVVTVPVPEQAPLGSPKKDHAEEVQVPQTPAAAPRPTPPPKPVEQPAAATHGRDRFSGPQSGQTFLQVAAVGHTEANALADVLSKKGFHAHAVAKPGANDVYRVLIGPMRDTSDLSTTRDSLRNAGFTKIFVQKY